MPHGWRGSSGVLVAPVPFPASTTLHRLDSNAIPWSMNDEIHRPRAGVVAASARFGLAMLVFLASIRLLGEATGFAFRHLAPMSSPLLREPVAALGVGWLATYVLTNGSVVAALGVTLTGVGGVDPTLTIGLVSGSRLGGAAFVVVVGIMDHLRRPGSVRSKLELGVLTFLLSHLVYVPATLLTWTTLSGWVPPVSRQISRIDTSFLRPGFADTVAGGLVGELGPVFVAVAGVAGLFGSVALFDRALRGVDLEAIRARISLDRPWLSFLAGMIVTGLTSSVAFSIGVFVPLFNRGGITRSEIAPYVVGASVTTLLDTFVVAIVLESWDAGAAVIGLMGIAFVFSVACMVSYPWTWRPLDRALNTLLATRTAFVVFLASLLVVPVVLVLVGVGL